ncbi:MAG: type III-B CRISPR-associated protein Cas10/Cmr2 [Thermoanaerobaculia bacterium]
MAHVLIVTLGPIQDFIAAARRTRDLWFGSWLLSELSKATAQAMAEECGIRALVFPGISDQEELYAETPTSVANKIVIRVPDGKDPAAVAKRGKEGMQARLDWLRDQAFSQVSAQYFERKTAEDQVNDLIEYVWVSAPESDPKGYSDARRKAEELLAARKSTRLWDTVTWGKDVPKSAIDGERESVLHEDLFNQVGKDGGLTAEQVRQRYGVGKAERLCGVGLLKRHGRRKTRYSHRFLSTGHLAAWPIYHRLKKTPPDADQQRAWDEYLRALAQGGVVLKEQEIVQGEGWEHTSLFEAYDGSLLFENRLPELFEEAEETGRREESLREARTVLSRFLATIGVPTPVAYYAILVADGDRMGKAIERQTTFKAHRDLSRKLDQFAQRVRTIVERDHGGELVYSGGDDVLAFVPLHKAVPCARELAETFKEHLSDFPVDDGGEETPTLSAGIGVSHFIDPLRSALNLARKAEALAKEKRNSLAVIVDKRSGPPVEIKGVWGALDERLETYVTMHRNDWVPDGAAYELRELARLLDGAGGTERASLLELVRKEAERILRRKQPQHGAQKELAAAVLARLVDDVKTLELNEVADGLIVARLLAQAWEEAEPTPPGGRP